MRKDHEVLRHGSIDAPMHLDEHIIVLARHYKNDWAITAMNNDTQAKTIEVILPEDIKEATQFIDAFSKESVIVKDRRITISIPAQYGVVLFNKQ